MPEVIVRRRLERPPHHEHARDTPVMAAMAASTGASSRSVAGGRATRIAGREPPRSRRARFLIGLFALASSLGAAWWLGTTGIAAVVGLSWWRPDSVIAVSLLFAGAAIAGWYAVTALAVVLSLAASVDLDVRTWGAPLLRRLGTAAGAGSLAVTAFAGPALATVPDDLTWGGMTSTTTERGEDPVSPDPASQTPEDLTWGAVLGPDDEAGDALPHPPEAPPASAPTVPESAPTVPAQPSGEEEPALPGGSASLEDSATGLHETSTSPPGSGVRDMPRHDADALGAVPSGTAALSNPAAGPPFPGSWLVRAIADAAQASGSSTTHTVEPGESLWRIAAAERPHPTDRWIADRVHAYIAVNPHLAANPDLIHPGDTLAVPGDFP